MESATNKESGENPNTVYVCLYVSSILQVLYVIPAMEWCRKGDLLHQIWSAQTWTKGTMRNNENMCVFLDSSDSFGASRSWPLTHIHPQSFSVQWSLLQCRCPEDMAESEGRPAGSGRTFLLHWNSSAKTAILQDSTEILPYVWRIACSISIKKQPSQMQFPETASMASESASTSVGSSVTQKWDTQRHMSFTSHLVWVKAAWFIKHCIIKQNESWLRVSLCAMKVIM